MQALLDLIPIALFLVAFKFGDIFLATAVLVVATLVQVAWQWFRHRKVSGMLLTSAALVLVFGGITLYFHDERFILWKPTVLYALFAAAFALSTVVGEKPLVQRLLGHQLRAERGVWQWATWQWALLFIGMAAFNAVLVLHFSRDAWANWQAYKVGVVLLASVLQVFWLGNRAEPVEPAEPPADAEPK
jgi:intracellular septation protein